MQSRSRRRFILPVVELEWDLSEMCVHSVSSSSSTILSSSASSYVMIVLDYERDLRSDSNSCRNIPINLIELY